MAKKSKKPEFVPVNEGDLNPYHQWHRPLQAPGITQVDFEERVNFPASIDIASHALARLWPIRRLAPFCVSINTTSAISPARSLVSGLVTS
jgi:hypothetical protein